MRKHYIPAVIGIILLVSCIVLQMRPAERYSFCKVNSKKDSVTVSIQEKISETSKALVSFVVKKSVELLTN